MRNRLISDTRRGFLATLGHRFFDPLQDDSNIVRVCHADFYLNCFPTAEDRSKPNQSLVVHISVPALDEDTIFWMNLKIFRIIVHNHASPDVTAQRRKVFDEDVVLLVGVLAVQSVSDDLVFIDLVENPVGVLRQMIGYLFDRCGKDH